MTDKEIQKSIKRIKRQNNLVRSDIKVLQKMVEYVDAHIDDLNTENCHDFDQAVCEMEDQLKVVELFG